MSFLGGFEGNLSEDEELEDNFLFEAAPNSDNDQKIETTTVKVKKIRKKKRKRHSSDDEQPEEEVEMPMFPVEIAESETDSDRLFLLSFLPEMRQLPLNIKMWVRAQIANVMQEAVSCHYNNTRPGTSSEKNHCFDIKRQRQDSTE